MRKVIGISLVILGTLAFVVILAVGASGGLPPSYYTHEGKALISEQEYQDFKAAMVAPEITNLEVTMLNHDYPMLLEYKFQSNSDTPISVNDKVEGFCFLTLLCFLGFIPFICGLAVYREEK